MAFTEAHARSAKQRAATVAVGVVAVVGAVATFFVVRSGDGFEVGDSRAVTVSVGECWRPEVTVGGRLWVAPSSDPSPASWGQGPEHGVIERVGDDDSVFTATDGQSVSMLASEFHDATCPINPRSS